MNSTKTRATVIKLPDATPGLLIVEGVQKNFVLEGIWRAAVAPAVGMTVEVELARDGAVSAIHAMDARELAREQGQQVAALARKGFGAALQGMGGVTLGATAVLWLSWFFLPTLAYGWKSMTLWEVLGFDPTNVASLMTGGNSFGLFSLLGFLSIAAPFGVLFLRGPRATWLHAAPLGFLVLWSLKLGWQILSAVSEAERVAKSLGSGLGEAAGSFGALAVSGMLIGIRQGISVGFWLVVLSSIVLFVQALRGKRVLALAAGTAQELGRGVSANPKLLRYGAIGTAVVMALGGTALAAKRLLKSPSDHLSDILTAMNGAIAANQADCNAMGAALQAVAKEHEGDINALRELPTTELVKLLQESALDTGPHSMRPAGVAGCAFTPSVGEGLRRITHAFEPRQGGQADLAGQLEHRNSLFPPSLPNVAAPALAQRPQPVAPPNPSPFPDTRLATNAPTPAAPAIAAPAPEPALQAPAANPTPSAAMYALFDVPAGDSLSVRVVPDAGAAKVHSFAPGATGIGGTGKMQLVAGSTWLELITPSGTGWANRTFLLEQPGASCNDGRVGAVVDRFITGARGGQGPSFAAAISPTHGLLVRSGIDAPSVRLQPALLGQIFTSPTKHAWPAPGSFKDVIAPALLATLAAQVTHRCGVIVPPPGDTSPTAWPSELRPLLPLTLVPSKPETLATWVLGIASVSGGPYVAALVQYPAPKGAQQLAAPKVAATPAKGQVEEAEEAAKVVKPEPERPDGPTRATAMPADATAKADTPKPADEKKDSDKKKAKSEKSKNK